MISIIIPAYNAERYIGHAISELRSIKNSQIIVVCNNCSDNTYEEVELIRKKQRNIINLNFPYYTGKGGAILHGFAVAKGDIIGFIDADNAFDIKDIKGIISLTKKYTCVIASKWMDKEFIKIDQPFLRKLYSRTWNFLIRILFNLNFSDTQAGLKFFKRKVINNINRNFICTGFDFDIELLWKIKEAGYKVHEVPVNFRKVGKSTVLTTHIFRMLLNLLRLRLFHWMQAL